MNAEVVSARFRKQEAAVLEQIAKEQKIDKTTALRKIFELGTKQYLLEKAIKEYQEGKASIGKTAQNAGVTIWEIMEELARRNIANPMSKEDFIQSKKNLEKVWK